jgi:hypothetical protein
MLKQPIYLEWDSAFFLLKTGKIEYTCFDEDNIYEIIENARNSAYKLLYIFCKKDFYFSENVKHKYNIKLVDRKIVYKRNLEGRSYQNYADEYKLNVLVNELEELAYASGKHSRFYIDKNIDKKYFYRLYRTWIEKSITKEMANKIFIKRNGGGGGLLGW